MKRMPTVPGTVFHELDPVRIVLLVLARRVRPLLALGALELDRGTRLNPGHPRLPGEAGDGAGADGAAALADGEALADLEADRGDQLDAHLDVVAGHDHLGPIGQPDRARHVRRPEVELGPETVVERRVPDTLVLRENVDLSGELRVRLD